MATSQQSTTTCPECAGRVRPDGTETICAACGLVTDTDRIDRGPDWRGDDDRDQKHAEGVAPLHGDRGLGTDLRGFGRKGVWHNRAKHDKKDRNRAYATTEIQRIGTALSVASDLVEQAKYVFVQLHDADEAHGKDLDVLAPTCLYTVLRKHQRGRTPDELASVARCDARPIARRHRWVCDALGLLVPPPDPEQRLRVVAGELGASHALKRRAVRLLARCEPGGEKPSTLAAAVLYEVGPWTQAEASEAAGVSAVALRERWQDMDTDGQTTVAEFGVAV